jgi:hypothetical protein
VANFIKELHEEAADSEYQIKRDWLDEPGWPFGKIGQFKFGITS